MSDKYSRIPKYTEAPRPPRVRMPPIIFIYAILVALVASWLPLVFFARAKASLSTQPRVQLLQDMGMQPKYHEQQSSDIFADGRADRPEIVGTVARGKLNADDGYFLGYERTVDPKTGQLVPRTAVDPKTGKPEVQFQVGFPKEVKVDAQLFQRGQERFNIYCSVCHGLDGYGHGPVNERGLQLQLDEHGTWVQAADLTKDPVKSRPEGHIYNTINVGIRNMPGYGPQIPVEDRWAIVAYVRALQLSQDTPTPLVSPEVRKAATTGAQ